MEKNIDMQEKHGLGATQKCTLDRNGTGDLWLTGWHPIHWATSARAKGQILIKSM